MTPLDPLPRALLAALVLAAGFTDWRERRIPNWLNLAGLAAGLAAQLYVAGWSGLRAGVLGAGAGFAITLPFFLIRGLGAGDVKLFTAVGAITGAMNLVYLFLLNSILGGVAALALVAVKGRLLRTLRNVGAILTSLATGQAPHHTNAELSIDHKDALTLPRGLILAVTVLVLLATRQL